MIPEGESANFSNKSGSWTAECYNSSKQYADTFATILILGDQTRYIPEIPQNVATGWFVKSDRLFLPTQP